MKQIGYYIGAAAIALGAFTSCTLDAENYTEKSTQNFPKTKTTSHKALQEYIKTSIRLQQRRKLPFFSIRIWQATRF